jgi:chitinase
MNIYLLRMLLLFQILIFPFFSENNLFSQVVGSSTQVVDSSMITIYKAPANNKFQVIGYMYRNLGAIPDSKLKMLDVVNYAFATINSSLLPVISQPDTLRLLVSRCKELGVKVLLSFNGSQQYFLSMTSQKSSRDKFVSALMQMVRQYNLDGIDNDWEYPSTADGTSNGNALLMKQLSDSCHINQKYLLTMAITSGIYVGATSSGILDVVFNDVDWFNVMIYDNFSTTKPYIQHSPYSMLLSSYNYWITTRNLPRTKFVTGLPLYGRPSGITQTGTVLYYKDILAQGANYLLDSAIVSSPSYPTPYTIYYNGLNTIQKKVNFSTTNGLGGVMFWEIMMDTNDNRSLIQATNDLIGNVSSGIQEVANQNNILFTNPVRETVQFTKTIRQATIYSLSGIILINSYNNNNLSISGLSKGIYLIRIVVENGDIYTNKLIVY